MLTLSIMRHAKSSWRATSLRDIDRPLNDRGKAQAKMIGSYLSDKEILPDLIICSSAKRACQTLKNLQKNWPSDTETIIDDQLYLASVNTILTILDKRGQQHSHIMIIGHNPGLHMLASSLAMHGDEADLALLREKYPTGTFCQIEAQVQQWKKIAKVGGKLIYLATPKQLAS